MSVCRSSRPVLPSLAAVAAAAVLLGGCAGAPGPAPRAGTAGPAPVAVGPAACARPITEFEAILNNDRRIGYLGGMQHGRILSELRPARATCAAGRAGEANRQLAAVRTKNGYR